MKSGLVQHLLHQVRSDYNTIASHFAQTRMNQWDEVAYLIEQYVRPGHSVLDAGCGNGRVADLVNEIKATYLGLDVSEELIRIARLQHPDNEFTVGSMLRTGLPNNTFDYILCIASFHHIPGISARCETLEELKRILKPGGMIIMTNWNLHQWQYTITRWRFRVMKLFGMHTMDWNDVLVPWRNASGELLAKRYYHSFTKKEMRHLARKSALVMVDQYYERNGMHVTRRTGKNLVTILEKEQPS